jgi:hypothetical protein
VDDLELSSVIHSKIFKTENHFGTHVSKEWSKHITSNVNFLQDTQSVINNMKKFNAFPKLDTNRVIEIWQDTNLSDNCILVLYSISLGFNSIFFCLYLSYSLFS